MTDKEKAIYILNSSWKRSFYKSKDLKGYIKQVKRRLENAGFKNVPIIPAEFFKYCQKIGLYRKGEK